MSNLVAGTTYIIGAVLADGIVATFIALLFPPYAWLLFVIWLLEKT